MTSRLNWPHSTDPFPPSKNHYHTRYLKTSSCKINSKIPRYKSRPNRLIYRCFVLSCSEAVYTSRYRAQIISLASEIFSPGRRHALLATAIFIASALKNHQLTDSKTRKWSQPRYIAPRITYEGKSGLFPNKAHVQRKCRRRDSFYSNTAYTSRTIKKLYLWFRVGNEIFSDRH